MSGNRIGYARVAHVIVSTRSDSLRAQTERLTAAGCTQIFSDAPKTGIGLNRPGLKAALAALGPGDTLVACDLKRISRSLRTTLHLRDELDACGVHLEFLDDAGRKFTALAASTLSEVMEEQRKLAVSLGMVEHLSDQDS